METLPTGEIIGIGAVALAFLTAFLKIWNHSSKTTDRVIDVVIKNTEANHKLSTALNGVKEATQKNTEASKESKDKFTELLLAVLKNK